MAVHTTSFSKIITADERETLLSSASKHIPKALGRTVMRTSQTNNFELTIEDRTDSIIVTYILEEESQIVSNDAALVESNALLFDGDKYRWIKADCVTDCDTLPLLKQAFYKGEFWERDADMEYVFSDGEVETAVPSPNPTPSIDDMTVFTAIERFGGNFPRKWLLETKESEYYLLRERSGRIRLCSDAGNGEEIINVFVGREHPGTNMTDSEVLSIISSFENIRIKENYEDSVSKEGFNRYWADIDELGLDVNADVSLDATELDIDISEIY